MIDGTVAELAAALRARKLSSVELTRALLGRSVWVGVTATGIDPALPTPGRAGQVDLLSTVLWQARVQAAWHRARSKAESVPVGPQFYGVAEGTYLTDIGSLPGATTGGNDESNDALWNLGAP